MPSAPDKKSKSFEFFVLAFSFFGAERTKDWCSFASGVLREPRNRHGPDRHNTSRI